jgi:hypothetical protein
MGPDTSTQGTQPSDTRAAASRIGFSIWSPGHARLALLIFALAMAVMMLEVTLTRIFSFITFHHMTYLVIGMAMLGFGAAGTYLTVRPVSDDPSVADRHLAHHAALMACATVVALLLVPRIPLHAVDMHRLYAPANLLALAPIVVLSALPFFFGGVCVADLIGRGGARVHAVYFADLAGSAAGCLVSVLLVNHLGAMATALGAAALAMLAGGVATHRRPWLYLAAAAAIAALVPVADNRHVFPLAVPPGKQMYGNEASIETVRWHVITRLDVGKPQVLNASFGGALSRNYQGPAPRVRLVFQDGSNLTGIIAPTPTPEATPVLGYYLQGAAYVANPHAEALVIGAGGGIDVAIALHHGARHVVAVDVNPQMIELVTGKYADFAGHLFQRPEVEPVAAEGRHFLGRDPRKYDVIQLSGVDTWAALASGAYALTENFIYTHEAFDAYLGHLTPRGIVGFSRPFFAPPLETIRLAATALEALVDLGESEPWRHLAILVGTGQRADGPWFELLVKRSPFAADEVAALAAWARPKGFEVVYDPFTVFGTGLDTLIRATPADRRAMLARHPLSLEPVSDDKPFYFQFYRWRDLGRALQGGRPPIAMLILAASFVEVLLLSAVFILYPLYRRAARGRRHRRRLPVFAYFAALGAGFILVEISLLEKLTIFLGGPAYALAITLAALLFSSGLGSFLSGRLAWRPLRLIAVLTPVLALVIVLEGLSVEVVVRHLLGLPLWGRALATVALIAPLGLLLGTPFPTGLRFLHEVEPEVKPWAWGINACATVVGTSACMLIVSAFGFRAAFFLGAAVYLLGWALLMLAGRQPRAGCP